MTLTLPEKPILIYPSLAATIGLEEATLLSLLIDITSHQKGTSSQSYQWHHVDAEQLRQPISFWDDLDIQRITQRLRDLGLILLRSAPYAQSQVIDFAFNQSNESEQSIQAPAPQIQEPPKRHLSSGAYPIAANWQPDQETLISLGQLNIPEHFARDQIPEFVRYWRESGEVHRSWGSKFISFCKRQWTFHATALARQNRATRLPNEWRPSPEVQQQIASEGIPSTFTNKVLRQFCRYHQHSNTTYLNWDMPFFSWVKEEWQKQDTPFINSKPATGMQAHWRPDQHTQDYLTGISNGIDQRFVEECIPEFIHKWTEKQAIYSEWGKVFAEHVIEQWRFVQAGVNRNPEKKPISRDWRPSADCLEILKVQSGVDSLFIESQIPEFILYWTNRAEPRHSWDNTFLRHIKYQWDAHLKEAHYERQPTNSESIRTKDRSIAEQLSDTSWAS